MGTTTTQQRPSEANFAESMGLTLADQVAGMAAPEALQLVAGELDKLKSAITNIAGAFEAKHPIAAQAIVNANVLLAKLFPQETGLLTDLKALDL